jgi:hypothetical protein
LREIYLGTQKSAWVFEISFSQSELAKFTWAHWVMLREIYLGTLDRLQPVRISSCCINLLGRSKSASASQN